MWDEDPATSEPALLDPFGRIRCPLCAWQPRRDDEWMCTCGAIWNTFETRGRCPECAKQWEWTQCLRCDEFSLHERWHEGSPGAGGLA